MFDLAVIGAGPGGYVAAIRGAQQGLRVLLIEKDAMGGTCLNRGCIPTKSFVADTKLFKSAKGSPVLSGAGQLALDPQKMLARKRSVVDGMVRGLGSVIASNGITVINGTGALHRPGSVRVTLPDGTFKEHKSKHIILATGSRPAVPPFIDVDGKWIQTTDEILDCEDIPSRLIIIGGGVIGIEMATIFLNLGSKVTIVEMLEDVLVTEDKDIRRTMRRLLKKQKARLFLKARAQKLVANENGVAVTLTDKNGAEQHLEADRVLVSTGRAPVFAGIDPDKLGLALDGPFVKVDRHFQTNLPGVYAIGDLVGGMMLAHKASAEAEVVIEHILGNDHGVDVNLIPRCIWGLSEIGAVGLSEEQAQATGRNIKLGRFPFSASGAAQAKGHGEGFVKIVGDAETGEILGVHILGERATDLISEVVTVMKMEGAVEDLYEAIKPHPTLSETVFEAAMDWNGVAIHIPKKKI